MALRKAGVPIQFAGGISTKEDHKSVPATQLLNLENATFIKKTTLAKRNGYTALSTLIDTSSAAYGTARGLAQRGDDLVLFDNFSGYSYRPSANRWSSIGETASVVASDVQLARSGTQQWIPDAATRNGVTAIAWEDSRGGVWCSVVEDTSGRVLLAQNQLDSLGSMPRCLECGENVLIIWAREATGILMATVINPVTPSATPITAILTNDLDIVTPVYDACPTLGAYDALTGFTTDRPGAIAWSIAGGYRVAYLHPSGVLGSPGNGLPSAATFLDAVTGGIAVAVDKSGAVATAVVWAGDSGGAGRQVHGRFHTPGTLNTATRGAVALNLGAASTSQAIRLTCEYGATTSGDSMLHWAADHTSTRTDLNFVRAGKAMQSASTFDATTTSLLGHCLLTRAFHDGATQTAATPDGHVYVTVARSVRFFPYAMVIRISGTDGVGSTNTVSVARLVPGISAGAHVRNAGTTGSAIKHLSSVEDRELTSTQLFARKHRIPLSYRIQLDSSNGDQFSEIGIKLSTCDFNSDTAYQTAELGRGMYLAGACPQLYDADRFVEADYHTAPDWGSDASFVPFNPEPTEFVDATPGGSIAAGTYGYKIWYEDVDAQGEVHPGPVSVQINTVVAAGSSTVTITIPTYRLTRKRNVRICVARSEANATGDPESIRFFRVTGVDPQVNTGSNRYVANDTSVDSVTFVDALSDANLRLREPLYTNGGILSNDPAPWGGGAIAGGKSRLFWTDPSDPNLIRYSQEIRDDFGLEAPVDLTLRCDPYGGAIVGIGVMDDAVYVLKETAIYVFGGPGTAADGGLVTQSAFTPPAQVTSDVGCKAPKSIAQTPIGIVFQSSKGIMLIGRGRDITSIGDPVYAFNDQTITRATLLPDRHQIVFLTDDGTTLLFDYERGQWSKFTNHIGVDAVVLDGTYHYLRTDGRVFQETPGVYIDDNSHISMKIETAWIKMAGYLQGWQRVHHALFIGEYVSSHTLRVRYRIDYQDVYSAPIDIAVDADVSGDEFGEAGFGDGAFGGAFPNPGTVYQQRIHINQRCEAITFEVSDVEDTTAFGAAFELSEMLLTGGILKSDFALPATRSS